MEKLVLELSLPISKINVLSKPLVELGKTSITIA